MRTTDWAAQRLRLASRTFINLDRISRDSGELFRKPSPTHPFSSSPLVPSPPPSPPSLPPSSSSPRHLPLSPPSFVSLRSFFFCFSRALSCRNLPSGQFTRKLRAGKPSEYTSTAARRRAAARPEGFNSTC